MRVLVANVVDVVKDTGEVRVEMCQHACAKLGTAVEAGPAAGAGLGVLELIDLKLAADDVVRELVTN